jgi:hypothetical protein
MRFSAIEHCGTFIEDASVALNARGGGFGRITHDVVISIIFMRIHRSDDLRYRLYAMIFTSGHFLDHDDVWALIGEQAGNEFDLLTPLALSEVRDVPADESVLAIYALLSRSMRLCGRLCGKKVFFQSVRPSAIVLLVSAKNEHG